MNISLDEKTENWLDYNGWKLEEWMRKNPGLLKQIKKEDSAQHYNKLTWDDVLKYIKKIRK